MAAAHVAVVFVSAVSDVADAGTVDSGGELTEDETAGVAVVTGDVRVEFAVVAGVPVAAAAAVAVVVVAVVFAVVLSGAGVEVAAAET